MMKTIQGYTYRVNEQIGKGYSSTVHKGIHQRTGQPVSIKVIEMCKLQDPINKMLLQHEVTALKKLNYAQHILHLYDVYATKNNTYLITELCDGDLSSTLKIQKQLPYYEAVDILQQLIDGYINIHQVGYIHRDIKPANIFYKAGKFKIGDFGFAIPIKEINEHKNYNVGSPVYMPPQALKSNQYSISCDIWALGIILFQMLKGAVPWRALSEQKLYQKMKNQPLEELTFGLPEVVRSFLSQVLAIDPYYRTTLDQLRNWPSKLTAVDIRSPSPCRTPTSLEPLQQIKNFNITMRTDRVNLCQIKQFGASPMKAQPPEIRQIKENLPKQYSLKQIVKSQTQNQLRDVEFFAVNSINYLKFINRIIKFLKKPTKVYLPQLQNTLINHLIKQTEILLVLVNNKNVEIQPIKRWIEFLKSKKGENFYKKINLYSMKYSMFYERQDTELLLTQEIIAEGIREIMEFLNEQENYSMKLVIAADYLTTLYQLIQLKSKYSVDQFIRISKIDLINQGSPYQANPEHLRHLRRKLLLLKL